MEIRPSSTCFFFENAVRFSKAIQRTILAGFGELFTRAETHAGKANAAGSDREPTWALQLRKVSRRFEREAWEAAGKDTGAARKLMKGTLYNYYTAQLNLYQSYKEQEAAMKGKPGRDRVLGLKRG